MYCSYSSYLIRLLYYKYHCSLFFLSETNRHGPHGLYAILQRDRREARVPGGASDRASPASARTAPCR